MTKPFTGADLRVMRIVLGFTQAEVGEAIGIHANTIMKYEQQDNLDLPKTVRLAIAAWVFGLPPFQGGKFEKGGA